MAAYRELTREHTERLERAFGVEVETVAPIAAGSVNSNYRLDLADGARMFARVYEEQDRGGAEREAHLLDHLAARGVPTPRPLPRVDGDGFTTTLPFGDPGREPDACRAAALFPWVEGDSLCQARVGEAAARRIGAELARVHLAGASFTEPRAGRFEAGELRARIERIAVASEPELSRMAGPLAAALDELAPARDPGLPGGVIHGDLFRDNVLWRGEELVALLDFESASRGPWAYDMMVTVLAWCYGADFDTALVRAVFDGYRSIRPLARGELEQLAVEGRFAALRFTITRITDYAMRAGVACRIMKDWRRFWARYHRVGAIGNEALVRLYG